MNEAECRDCLTTQPPAPPNPTNAYAHTYCMYICVYKQTNTRRPPHTHVCVYVYINKHTAPTHHNGRVSPPWVGAVVAVVVVVVVGIRIGGEEGLW